jgi:uncharacterized membrane protein YdjX (TVP38/TMEM64 family)
MHSSAAQQRGKREFRARPQLRAATLPPAKADTQRAMLQAASMSSTKRALSVLLTALLVPIVPFVVIGELPGERWLMSAGGDGLRFGATGAGLLALDVLLPIPSSIVGALLGGRLGFWAGAGWSFLGLTTGHCVGYALGRLTPARWASELPEAPSWIALLLSRPVPVFAEALAIAAGAERMPLAAFISSVALGDLAYAVALAADGAALLPEAGWGVGLIVPLLLPVAGYLLWRKVLARRATSQDVAS